MASFEREIHSAAERIRQDMRKVEDRAKWGVFLVTSGSPELGLPTLFGAGMILPGPGKLIHVCREDFTSADDAADWLRKACRRELARRRRSALRQWIASKWAQIVALPATPSHPEGREGA